MSRTRHPRPAKPKNFGKGGLKRATSAYRRVCLKHVPQQPKGFQRWSRRGLDQERRAAVRVQERTDLTRMRVDPEHETLAERLAAVHWTELEPYW